VKDWAPKTGRHSKTPVRVPEVESVQCKAIGAGGGNHVLRNRVEFRQVFTRCDYCGGTWADLDTELRAAIGWSSGSES
jgi:hypothetical protein